MKQESGLYLKKCIAFKVTSPGAGSTVDHSFKHRRPKHQLSGKSVQWLPIGCYSGFATWLPRTSGQWAPRNGWVSYRGHSAFSPDGGQPYWCVVTHIVVRNYALDEPDGFGKSYFKIILPDSRKSPIRPPPRQVTQQHTTTKVSRTHPWKSSPQRAIYVGSTPVELAEGISGLGLVGRPAPATNSDGDSDEVSLRQALVGILLSDALEVLQNVATKSPVGKIDNFCLRGSFFRIE